VNCIGDRQSAAVLNSLNNKTVKGHTYRLRLSHIYIYLLRVVTSSTDFCPICYRIIITFCVIVDDAKCIVVTRVCVSVCVSICLSTAVRPHYCTEPDVTCGRGRRCPLVVRYWADLQSVHGLRCYGNITRTLVTSLRPSSDMTT